MFKAWWLTLLFVAALPVLAQQDCNIDLQNNGIGPWDYYDPINSVPSGASTTRSRKSSGVRTGIVAGTLFMTAPMVVTNWINMQYHASTVDNRRYGSGNKLLHNVVGGDIGVFEGNGGDLRIGLSLQSLHDGRRWVHDPLRLTVVIDAPAASIDRIVQRHAIVRQLLDNGWLHLWRFEGEGFERRVAGGGWRALASDRA